VNLVLLLEFLETLTQASWRSSLKLELIDKVLFQVFYLAFCFQKVQNNKENVRQSKLVPIPTLK